MRIAPQLRRLTEQQILRALKSGHAYYDPETEAILPTVSGAAQAIANFDGGTNGSTIAAADAGSTTKWDVVTIGTGATATYDNVQFHSTPNCGKFTTGGTAATAFCQWGSATLGTITDAYGRAYIYLGANPASAGRAGFAQFLSSGTIRAQIRINTTGKIELWGPSTALVTVNTAISLNQWVRIEWHFTFSSTVGFAEAYLYNSPDSTTATDHNSGSSLNLGGASTNQANFGLPINASSGIVRLDDIGWNFTSYPGPNTTSKTGSDAQAFSSATALHAFLSGSE